MTLITTTEGYTHTPYVGVKGSRAWGLEFKGFRHFEDVAELKIWSLGPLWLNIVAKPATQMASKVSISRSCRKVLANSAAATAPLTTSEIWTVLTTFATL